MKNLKDSWKYILVFTVVIMILGICISIDSLREHNEFGIWAGLAIIVSVCASWWFWVMMVIRSTMESTERTIRNLNEVKDGISEVKELVKDYGDYANQNTSSRKRGKS